MPRALAAAIEPPHRQHRAERIGHVREGEQPGAGAHQRLDRLGVHLAARIHRGDHQSRAGLLAQNLPGHDVRVVLEMRDEHLIVAP